jgi:hypothetical protein
MGYRDNKRVSNTYRSFGGTLGGPGARYLPEDLDIAILQINEERKADNGQGQGGNNNNVL